MTISNELSSEIAAALLTIDDRSADELSNLRDIVLQVHWTLQQMNLETRDRTDVGPNPETDVRALTKGDYLP